MKGASFLVSLFLWFILMSIVFDVPRIGVLPLILLIFAVLIPSPGGIEVQRILDKKNVRIGEVITVNLEVRVKKGIGLVFIRDTIPPMFEVIGRPYASFFVLPWRRKFKFSYSLIARKRGKYELPKTEVYSFHVLRVHPTRWMLKGESVEIVVTSHGYLKVSPHRILRASMTQAIMYSRFGPTTTDFKEIREYRPGDPFKAINWKATARVGRLLVNEFEREGRKTVMIILDARMEKLGSYFENPLEYGIKLSMILADFYLSLGNNVGLYILGQGKLVTPASSMSQRETIVKALLSAGLDKEETLENAFKNLEIILRRFSPAVILITNLTEDVTSEITSLKRDLVIIDVSMYGEISEEGSLVELKKQALRKAAQKRVIKWDVGRESPHEVLLKLLGVVE
ncbi:DUF58 domain-containing protein [Pyrococcus kukulkanii]|uniref:DUF58 domain-containing protein n=1 Tax=Pyrococcus kukulkanii TaxID=1609559 RepID=UPI003561D486